MSAGSVVVAELSEPQRQGCKVCAEYREKIKEGQDSDDIGARTQLRAAARRHLQIAHGVKFP